MKISWTILGVVMALATPMAVGADDKFEFPLAVSSRVLGFAPAWVADKKGFFEREGLDVVVTTTRGTSPAMQALAAESVHAALASNDGPIGLVEKGLDLAIIAGGSKTTHMIMGGENITSFEDLRGKVIGSSTLTSGTAFLLRRVLKEKGLEYPKDYSLVNVGGSGPSLIALSTGRVAAGILSVPISFRAAEMGLNLIGKVSDVFPNYLLSSFSVRREWANHNRPQVVRFLRALLQARKWLGENRDGAAQFLAAELQMKPDQARKGLDYYIENRAWEPDLGVDVEGLKSVVEIYAEQVELKGPLPDPKKYVDMSFLQTALKELGWQ
ncbi:MAG TPA: ABC transporter substrate-binding protein [Candidatus Limnocylindria bacterium]|nr:ABC transporter substrate-binding protein [Candidatus Limnocylindria bacterium]